MSVLNSSEIAELRERYQLSVFVETGCYMGDGIQTALNAGFETVHSCDISPVHAHHCRMRYESNSNVHIFEGDSLSFLESLRGTNLLPALFWLDAHFPAFYGYDNLEVLHGRFPLLDELELLSRFEGIGKHVILADDMRVIADENNPRWRPGETDDYFTVRDVTINSLTQSLGKTHEARVDTSQEGILRLLPRSESSHALANEC